MMEIDKEIESLVREAFAASVAEEPDRFGNALAQVDRNDDVAARSFGLGYAVAAMTLLATHQGRRPDDARLRSLAYTFARTQAWSGVDEATALALLTALADGASPLAELPQSSAAIATFALGGWLLSGFLPEGQDWTDLLDEVLDKLESAPPPTP